MSEQPTVADTLYLDAEHLVLTTEAQPPLEPRQRVRPAGRPFPGLFPSVGLVRPGEEPTT
jgi:hypothetical protein